MENSGVFLENNLLFGQMVGRVAHNKRSTSWATLDAA